MWTTQSSAALTEYELWIFLFVVELDFLCVDTLFNGSPFVCEQ